MKGNFPWLFCCFRICRVGPWSVSKNILMKYAIFKRLWRNWNKNRRRNLGGWFQIFFYFHPNLGKWSILTNIFQRGWNHQPVFLRFFSFAQSGYCKQWNLNNLPADNFLKPKVGLLTKVAKTAAWTPQSCWGSTKRVFEKIWSNHSDWKHEFSPQMVVKSKGNPLISGKSGLVKCNNLIRKIMAP